MNRWSILIVVTLIVFLAGCSNEPAKNVPINQSSSNADQDEPSSDTLAPVDANQSEPQTSLTAEEQLMKAPGKFAGANYNEQNVQAALDQLPSDLTADQYAEELLLLLAEDYRPYVTTFINFETEIRVNNERPNGNMTLPESKKLHISILLDASGSMQAKINGISKMDSAKEAIQSFAEKMPDNAEVSLRVYGNKGTASEKDKEVSCNSTEEIFHGQGDQADQIGKALEPIKPAGWTPIANALKSVKQDINPETTNSLVYVVSDGIETCGGNPAQIAKELNQAKVKTVVNIIGFDVDTEGQKLLKQVAAAGGGEFTFVDNDESLKNYLDKAYDKLRGEWIRWKEQGEGQANIQKEQKQGEINVAQETMQGLIVTENTNLLAALRYLETKNDINVPHSELLQMITERKNFAMNYARDTGKRLYNEVTKNGTNVYDDIKDEGDKQIEDLTTKKTK
ncbi:VWA domain-containing protein [Paenibacillus lupini]|uniref:vWA domain-containing protein n=1 Tax=Paenibacillus lupini TaxID=1450204 RepID=UPI00141D7922|nr:VWA domain-containing protein [Paenibacillus lupini]NIK22724.1 D-amino-acid dehydrogenase/Ca-activated chloride channel family protein [Paenibacillus lupini]